MLVERFIVAEPEGGNNAKALRGVSGVGFRLGIIPT